MLMRADALIQAGRTDEANALAAKLHGTPSSNTLGSLVETVAALKANDPNKAAASSKAAGNVADNLQLRHLEGEVAAIRGDFPAAIAALGDSVRVTACAPGPARCCATAWPAWPRKRGRRLPTVRSLRCWPHRPMSRSC